MKTTTDRTRKSHMKTATAILSAVLLLGCGWVWAEKKTDPFQPKTDDSSTQNQQAQSAPLQSLNPFRDMIQLQQEMDRLFGSTLLPYSGFPAFDAVIDQDVEQAMDLTESQDFYTVKMDLPGMEKSDIKVEVADRVLTVSGERKESTEQKDGQKILRQERSLSSFRREVVLPGNINADQVTADYKAGVLTITLPKTAQQKNSHVIEIK